MRKKVLVNYDAIKLSDGAKKSQIDQIFMPNFRKLKKNQRKDQKGEQKTPKQTLQILGVGVTSTSTSSVLAFVRKKIAQKEKFWIATPNPEMIVLAQKDTGFKQALNSADLAIPDGVGLVWASWILGGQLESRLTGTDLMERLCQESAQNGWRVFFLGSSGDIAQKALEVLMGHYPGLRGMAEAGPELVISLPAGKAGNWELVIKDTKTNQKTIAKINQFAPDLLFVGFGMGKQELWILKYLDTLQIGGALVVGGAFDFWAGNVRRAPLWIRNIGLEWCWRLILQPWRIKRQTALAQFVFLILREKLSRFFSLNAQ